MIRKNIVLLGLSFLVLTNLYSQTKREFSVWTFWNNSHKFNDRWGLQGDIQVRSADEVKYIRQFIIRQGVTYYFNKKQMATLGYAFVENFKRDEGIPNNDLHEHRIWEQFVQQHKIARGFFNHRFRFEQRFLEQNVGDDVFSQRFRYSLKALIPFKKYGGEFKKGVYLSMQDEVFLNVQNKEKMNNSTFDQNRLYAGLGIRLNPKLDLELGYNNQYIKGLRGNTVNNITQVALITKF